MAYTPNSNRPQPWFHPWGIGNTSANYNLTNADFRWAAGFVAAATENMTGFKILHGSAGTPGTIQADLYAANDDFTPTGSSLASATWTWASNNQTTRSWGTPYAVTAGNKYCVLFKNNDGTPGTNYPIAYGTSVDCHGGIIQRFSSDAGATWNQVNAYGGFRNRYFCPVYATSGLKGVGFGLNLSFTNTGATGAMYTGTNYVGRHAIKFTPARDYWFHGLMGQPSKQGSPSFNTTVEVIRASDNSILATGDWYGNSVPPTQLIGRCVTPYQLVAGTAYYLAARPVGAASGDASNYLRSQTSQYDVNIGGGMTYTGEYQGSFYSTADPTISWTEFSNMLLLLPMLEPVTAAAGGGARFF